MTDLPKFFKMHNNETDGDVVSLSTDVFEPRTLTGTDENATTLGAL